MASSLDQTVDGTEDLLIEEGGQIIDRREFIEDPRNDRVDHPPLRTIFPLLLSCGKCKSPSFGTCFLLQYDLINVFGGGRDYHYFVTAGHNLVCKTCRDGDKMLYREIKIAWEWTLGKKKPDLYVCDTITANNDQGWIRVSDEFRTKEIGTSEAFLHDFGVIAVRKSVCLRACTNFFGKFTKECLRALSGQTGAEAAHICGYPGLIHKSVFDNAKPRNYHDLPDSKKEPGKKLVYGLMMRMPPTLGKAASSPSGQETPSDRSDRERSTTAAYGMPQHHCNDDSDKKESSQAENILYRYYIDTSPGQSGSPVYIEREDDNGDPSYYCVGIHVGTWNFSSNKLSCNVCFNVNEAIQRMKDEKWAEAVKGTPVVPAKANTNDIPIEEDPLTGHSLFGKSPRAAVVSKRSDTGNQDSLGARGHASGAGQKGVSSGGAATSQDFDRSDAGNQDALEAKDPWESEVYRRNHKWLIRLEAVFFRSKAFETKLITTEEKDELAAEVKGKQIHNETLLRMGKGPGGRGSFLRLVKTVRLFGDKYDEQRKDLESVLQVVASLGGGEPPREQAGGAEFNR